MTHKKGRDDFHVVPKILSVEPLPSPPAVAAQSREGGSRGDQGEGLGREEAGLTHVS